MAETTTAWSPRLGVMPTRAATLRSASDPEGDGDGAGPQLPSRRRFEGAEAATLRTALLMALSGATVVAVEIRTRDAGCEVHLTNEDGSEVTVTFDDAPMLLRVGRDPNVPQDAPCAADPRGD